MIRNSSRILHSCAAALLLSTGLVSAAQAQTQTTPDTVTHARTGFSNALRLDVGGVLARNLAYNMLNNNPQTLLPVLLGYEHRLGKNTSGNVEVLLNGGQPDEKMTGAALQGRYYFYQGRQTGLAGFYVAPTLSYRAVRQQSRYWLEEQRRKLGGAGTLLGAQFPVAAKGRLVLDVSGGVMWWKRLDTPPAEYNLAPAYYDEKTYLERNKAVFDGRLSLGYRF
ncbi:hypothetical protein [Hymenobacter pini]|uniref:hypothetical protein n=1 Tax=Hymenobacter pini TaxID=2880879 RepID=UPI001CF1EC46|nr:hypothetical protein [Hymenobacter pini]MCA8832352.1 hypothetical protein [Hymenobacter pini]